MLLQTRPPLALLLALVTNASCLNVDLAGRPCPCIDGFQCVDDVCIADDEATSEGEGEGDGGVEGEGEGEGGAEGEGEGEGEGIGECPAHFVEADACGGALPAHAVLQKVCDDGNTFPFDLESELGGAMEQCVGPPVAPSIASSSMTGTLDGGELALSGSVAFDVEVPASCVIDGAGCLQPSSGACSDDGNDGCACSGVTLDETTSDSLQPFGGQLVGNQSEYLGCATGGAFLLRATEAGRLGPIFLFR